MVTGQNLVLPGGRNLSYDDVGDPGGEPWIYLHGTPDSRLARHPDDDLTTQAGVRLLAIDRPGYGGTSTGTAFADDVVLLLECLSIERAGVVAWSGGALEGLRLAAAPALVDRAVELVVLAGLVPRDAYDDPAIWAAAPERLGLVELADQMPLPELVDMVASLLVPQPCDLALAREHQLEQRSPAEQARLEQVPGGVERMAEALVEALRLGLDGVRADLELQVTRLAPALDRLQAPVRLIYGADDHVAPAAFGEWYARRLPAAKLELIDGAGHYLPFTHWPEIARHLGGRAARRVPPA